jgi:uncharacterized protein (DUF4415 family)
MSGERIFRGTLEEIRRLPDESDWERLRAEEEAGIEPAPDEDDPDEGDIDWSQAVWVPARKKAVSLRLDADLVEYFKRGGPGYQTRINAVLRVYKDAQESKRRR